MATGITGALIPGGFLNDVLPSAFQREIAETRRSVPHTALAKWWRRLARELGPASSARRVLDVAALPLLDIMEYELLQVEPAGDGFAGLLAARGETRVLLLVLPWSHSPDHAWRDVQRAARTAGTRWALVSTGRGLHVLDAARTWARRSLDFELERVMFDEDAVLLLWALVRAQAVESTLDAVVCAAEAHAERVCHSLGDGVLAALGALVSAIGRSKRSRTYDTRAAFDQALTLVYRVLFLLFAEARAVVPTWHRVYREAYTIDALCRRSTARTRVAGLWESLMAISRLAHAGCHAGDLQVTPFNGRLFSPHHAPLVERSRIQDAVIREAVLALATGPAAGGRRRIAYADLGVEQLGAVYERVLEYEPATDGHGPVVLTRTSRERKSTGSFYTPRSVTEFLVRRTLHPLVDGKAADDILSLRIVDPAMGSGAFLVAACRFLSRAVERAHLASGEWSAADVTSEHRAEVRRSVAQRCLYGVDLNPTAVQLARLSLWLTTLATDRPLTFLDHHLASGDSLVGATLEDIARQPPGGSARNAPVPAALPLFDAAVAEDMAAVVLPDRYRLAEEPGDTPAAVRDKERALNGLVTPGAPLQRWKAAADLWCAGWFWPDRKLTAATYAELLSTLLQRGSTLPERQSRALLEQAAEIARTQRSFHWHLEFPEAFFDRAGRRRADGGFDAVLGNPPWDVMRSDTGTAEAREGDRVVQRERVRFFRSAGIYSMQSAGHSNRYQLFVERALQILKPGGRVGLILPSGLATDHGSAPLRRALLHSVAVDRLFGFSNRDAIFPIHRDMRFLLLTGTRGAATERLTCRFGLRQPAWLDALPDNARDDPPEARPIVLSRALLQSLDPERLAIPDLEHPRDLEILAQIAASIPRLGAAEGWQARFGRELNATDDRRHFRKIVHAAADELPIFEGKHLAPFRVRSDLASHMIPTKIAASLLDAENTFRRARLAYRDVASATNRLTLIAARLPADCISTHTLFCLKGALDSASQYCLLALLNSLVANYLVRLQVTTHVTASLMARLPVPKPERGSPEHRALVSLARELEATGIENNRESYARLNAIAAQLYGLTREQFAHVVGTFPLLPSELRRHCVAAYNHGGAEARRHGGGNASR
jgi:hypothetical protein